MARKQTDSVYRVVDVIGVSDKSWEDAGRRAVETAAGSLRDLRVAEVTKMDMRVENGKVLAFRTRVALSFKYEVLTQLTAAFAIGRVGASKAEQPIASRRFSCRQPPEISTWRRQKRPAVHGHDQAVDGASALVSFHDAPRRHRPRSQARHRKRRQFGNVLGLVEVPNCGDERRHVMARIPARRGVAQFVFEIPVGHRI